MTEEAPGICHQTGLYALFPSVRGVASCFFVPGSGDVVIPPSMSSPGCPQASDPFMVRKLNHRFKNFLTMSSSVCNAVMMCHRERYGHKMAFAARF
ncbi:hypothetical protein SY86_16905 [Erwinia tracheiphila]|uniref:Uncharacterized protein n=1 Tax=Erwinia tracheiphila TaxID=65700 RepID=A0A0M2KI73_9GAMM|nr:hypothetical protein SY86_16905 [Erwinia tracheiphila]